MQGTLNFLKLNKLFSAAIDINICNISPEWSNWGNNNRKENDVEQWQSNSETHQINNFETMDITFVMLGACWVKGWTPLKRTWLWLPSTYAWGKSIPESLDSFAQVKSWNRKLACLTWMRSSNIRFPYN